MALTEIALRGSRGVVQDGRVELDLGPASPLGDRLVTGLVLSAVLSGVGALVLVLGMASWRSLLYVPLFAVPPLAFHLALRSLEARGDRLRVVFQRRPGDAGPTYQVFHWNELVLSGAFTPQRLHVRLAAGAAAESAARVSWMYALDFRPDPPATMVHPRLRDGIEIFRSRNVEETAAQAAALCGHLGLDPAELAPDLGRAVDTMSNVGPLLWRRLTGRKER